MRNKINSKIELIWYLSASSAKTWKFFSSLILLKFKSKIHNPKTTFNPYTINLNRLLLRSRNWMQVFNALRTESNYWMFIACNHHTSNCISMYNLDLFPTTSSYWLTIVYATHGINWQRPAALDRMSYQRTREVINCNGLVTRPIIIFGVTLLYPDPNVFIIS